MRKAPAVSRSSRSAGFTLVELIVVVAIIATLAGVAIPSLGGYLRGTKIRTAASQVAGTMQAARSRGITKNVNFGVVFLIQDATHYRWVVEDDQDKTNGYIGARQPISVLLGDPAQYGPQYQLPEGIVFATASPTDQGIRFNRLGGACDPGSDVGNCPALDSGTSMVMLDALTGEFTIKLSQPSTGLSRTILVTTGGRIYIKGGN